MAAAALHAIDSRATPPAVWPIERPCLAALLDLGLSDGQLACYFRVNEDEVAALRASYGIAEHSVPVRYQPPGRRRFAWRRRA